MKHLISLAIPALFALTCAGCIVVQTTERRPPPPAERVVVVPATPEDSPTLAEIEAAAKLDFEGNRLSALSAIAQRPNLSPAVQVRLVNAAYASLGFDGNKLRLLQAIIANPSFCNPAKENILVQLNKLGFEGNRTAILDAINQRGALEK